MMRIALIGTRGVPARYGGFETAVEEIGRRLATRGHDVVVFCRPREGEEQLASYRGMTLVHLPAMKNRSLETLSHTTMSVFDRNLRGVDAAILFNAANSPLLPVLRTRRIPVATHVDGIEWKRAKWGRIGRRYYRVAEGLAVRYSDALIADAQGIADYYREEFGAPTRLIAYGAPILTEAGTEKLSTHGLEPQGYHLVVARFEPENHVLEIVRGYVRSEARRPLVVVGSAPYADKYTAAVRESADDRVKLVGGIWDQDLLDQLYANCLSYLHGHSVGGTNPSLLRAAGAGAFVIAYDVPFNREVVGGHAEYFRTPADVAQEVLAAEEDPLDRRRRGKELQRDIARYSWDEVADRYEQLLADLAARTRGRGKLAGARSGLRRRASAQSAADRERVGEPAGAEHGHS
jgi:glycosyltransferase involved in cell wall biosynthesis